MLNMLASLAHINYITPVVWLSGGWVGFHLRSCVVFVDG